MIARSIRSFALAAAFAAVAVPVLAFTVQEIVDRAVALDADFDDLLDRVVEAQPEEHASLQAEHAALEADRVQLVSDRQTLGSCSCTALDSLLADIAGTSDAAGVIIDGWHD